MPVRIGRVSSREAERATLAIVSTNAGAGIVTTWSPPGSGSGGKSSARSVRRWNVAVPATISTSCSAGRSSSETSPPGSWRTTSSSRRAGRTTCPSRSTVGLERDAQADLHVGRAQLDAPSSAASCTPESACTALRVEATRVTVCSCASSSATRSTASRWTPLIGDRSHRGCGDVDRRRKDRKRAGDDAQRVVDGSGGVCQSCRSDSRRWSRRSVKRRTMSEASGSAAMRSAVAPAGVEDGRVVAAAEARADGREGLVGVLAREVHGDLARPGDAGGAAAGEQLLAVSAEGLGSERPGWLDA